MGTPANKANNTVIRFSGDSGDGMQLVGDLFTQTSAQMGDDVATLPDYPAEIRAPAGTVAGVSGFQVCFGQEVFTSGDSLDVLVVMNPAALKTNLPLLKKNGLLLINSDAFIQRNWEKAGYSSDPLENKDLNQYRTLKMGMVSSVQKATTGSPAVAALTPRQIERCKNFFALGAICRLFNRTKDHTLKWLEKKFRTKPDVLNANRLAFETGWESAGEHASFAQPITEKKKRPAGTYRHVTGNEAAALGLLAAAQKAKLQLFLGSYPITPATDILHHLSKYRKYATVFQAEDEIAAIGASIGAAYGGALSATSTSGPGFSLKSEFLNLAVMVELPLIVVDVQRAGPSTGLPTKTEQSDLMQAIWGRHGESPVAVLAAASPRDCFDIMFEAARIATRYMTPVVVLSDGYLGNGSQVWRVPSLNELPEIKTSFRTESESFFPYERNSVTLARPWVIPGTAKMEHRVGGLEKEDKTGTVSHSPANHEKMVLLRKEKVARIAQDIAPLTLRGNPKAELLVVGWGSTQGVINETVDQLVAQGLPVAAIHLRHLNPLPKDLKDLLKKFPKILVPEINTGQLWHCLRAEYLCDAERLDKIQGQPFRADEIEGKIRSMLGTNSL